jgi:ERF superfamily.
VVNQGGPTLFKKLAKISGEISTVAKNGRNEHHQYDYVTEADLLNAVRAKLAAAGIAYFFSVLSIETREVLAPVSKKDGGWDMLPAKSGPVTQVMVSATFADGESGETWNVIGAGAGQDAGDKGIYKALTGAQKYLLMKTFLIATGDDPEGDAKVDKAAGEAATQAAPKTKASTAKATEAKPTEAKPAAAKVEPQAHGPVTTVDGRQVDDEMMKVLPGGKHKGRTIGSLTLEESKDLLDTMPSGNSWTTKVKKRHDYLVEFEKLPPAVQEAAAALDLGLASDGTSRHHRCVPRCLARDSARDRRSSTAAQRLGDVHSEADRHADGLQQRKASSSSQPTLGCGETVRPVLRGRQAVP